METDIIISLCILGFAVLLFFIFMSRRGYRETIRNNYEKTTQKIVEKNYDIEPEKQDNENEEYNVSSALGAVIKLAFSVGTLCVFIFVGILLFGVVGEVMEDQLNQSIEMGADDSLISFYETSTTIFEDPIILGILLSIPVFLSIIISFTSSSKEK